MCVIYKSELLLYFSSKSILLCCHVILLIFKNKEAYDRKQYFRKIIALWAYIQVFSTLSETWVGGGRGSGWLYHLSISVISNIN